MAKKPELIEPIVDFIGVPTKPPLLPSFGTLTLPTFTRSPSQVFVNRSYTCCGR